GLVWRSFLAGTELTRAFAGDIAKRAPECSQAVPADLERNLGDGQVRFAEQCLGSLQPTRQQVPVWWDAESLLERSCEVGLGDAAPPRQPRDGPVLVRGGVHPVLRAQEPAQQLWVLACAHLSLSAFEPCSHERPIRRLALGCLPQAGWAVIDDKTALAKQL